MPFKPGGKTGRAAESCRPCLPPGAGSPGFAPAPGHRDRARKCAGWRCIRRLENRRGRSRCREPWNPRRRGSRPARDRWWYCPASVVGGVNTRGGNAPAERHWQAARFAAKAQPRTDTKSTNPTPKACPDARLRPRPRGWRRRSRADRGRSRRSREGRAGSPDLEVEVPVEQSPGGEARGPAVALDGGEVEGTARRSRHA